MNERWTWLIRYLVVIAVALVLAATLGDMALFKTTKLGKTAVNAALVAQFLGYGGALMVLWLMAQRAAPLLPAHDGRWSVLKSILVPLATLLVVAAGQAVILIVLGPLFNKTWQHVYNWVAIAAILVSAAWLLLALFTGSSSLAMLFGPRSGARRAQSQA
jgi:hypothetical protein